MKYLKHRSLAVAAQPGAAQPGAAQPGVLLRSDFPDSPAFLRIYHFHVAQPVALAPAPRTGDTGNLRPSYLAIQNWNLDDRIQTMKSIAGLHAAGAERQDAAGEGDEPVS